MLAGIKQLDESFLFDGKEGAGMEDRISSSERKEDFHVDLPWSLFLEEFIRCF